MNYKWLDIRKENYIAYVAMNRVDGLNALSYELATEITEMFHEMDRDDEVRVIILTSNARIFSAGLDLMDAMSRGFIGTAKRLLDIPEKEKAAAAPPEY